MGETNIEWAHKVWNPIAGCSIVSPGCTNCYAMKMAHRIEGMNAALGRETHYAGLTMKTKAGAVWTGKVATAPDNIFLAPLRWKKPARVFANSMADLFHEDVSDATIDRAFAVMALCPHLTFMVLTKRADRMRAYFNGPYPNGDGVAARIAEATWALAPSRKQLPDPPVVCELPVGPRLATGEPEFGWRRLLAAKAWPLPNVWLGVSVEDRERADERIPDLLATPAAVRFISAEPLLSQIDLRHLRVGNGIELDALTGYHSCSMMATIGDVPKGVLAQMPILPVPTGRLSWCIAGGESGRNARPPHPDWFRSLRDQCQSAGAPFHFKQFGEWAPVQGSPRMVRAGDCFLAPDGRSETLGRDLSSNLEGVATPMRRVGKKAAGAMLDGREWREFPT